MSRKRRSLNERLEVTMNSGTEEFIGFQVEAEWESIVIPHHILLAEIVNKLPEYIWLSPEFHEAKGTFSWAMSRVHVSNKVDFKRVPSKKGFMTVQPHNVVAKKNDTATDDRYDHELEADNMPQIALRIGDDKVVAEDPNHPIAMEMALTFDFLQNKLSTKDVRTFVARLMHRLGGIKKLKSTSIWFVPWTEEAARILPALQEVIRSCESYADDADLYVTKMPRNEVDDVRCSTKSAQRTFASEYRTIFTQIEDFISGMFKGDVANNATLKDRLKLSKFLRERAKLYQDLLDLRSENMMKALEVIEEATEILMDGAGEYRATLKASKTLGEKEQESEKEAAKTDLVIWARQANELIKQCQDIFDPGENITDEAA